MSDSKNQTIFFHHYSISNFNIMFRLISAISKYKYLMLSKPIN